MPIVFTRNLCIKVKVNRAFSKSLLLIITDGKKRRMQMGKKAVFVTMPFWRSSNWWDS